MAPTFREAATGGGVSTNSVEAAFITPAAAGELLLAFVQWEDALPSSVLVVPDGWAVLDAYDGDGGGSPCHVAALWRRPRSAVTGLVLTFGQFVDYPRLLLAAYTLPALPAFGLRSLGGDAGVRQNAPAGALYAGIDFAPSRDNVTVAYFAGFAQANTVALAANPAATPDLRANLTNSWLFDGVQGERGRDGALGFAATTQGVKTWMALGVELWALPHPGERPAATFRPKRVWEDPRKKVFRGIL